jgi:hypothetical protein
MDSPSHSAYTKPSLLRFLGSQLRPQWKILIVALLLNALHGFAVTFQTLTPK